MHRFVIVVTLLHRQTGKTDKFATESVLMREGPQLHEETVRFLCEQRGFVRNDKAEPDGVTLVFPEGHPEHDHVVVTVALIPEKVYEPTPTRIADALVALAPFTLTPV